MSHIDITLKISNTEVQGTTSPARVTGDYPVINWSFQSANQVDINEYTGSIEQIEEIGQYSYEIRISTSGINVGTDSFIGNRVSTGTTISKDRFWNYSGYLLERGVLYYGQILVVDEFSRSSHWETFSFKYNYLPLAEDAVISPFNPSVTDNLTLTYNFYDKDDDIEDNSIIRWFKNGVHQQQFDNTYIIRSDFLQMGDSWLADVSPYDGYEYGERTTTPLVKVSQTALTVSVVEVLPKNPTENDLLEAGYVVSYATEQDNALIRWFVNGILDISHNDKKFARLNVIPGDSVRIEVKPVNGTIFVSSESVVIKYSDFVVYDVMIEGQKEPLEVSSVRPSVSWKIHSPYGKQNNYTSIKIGTFFEADNIYSIIVNNDKQTFVIPNNLLSRGVDYYVSIAVSDINSFSDHTSSHFRIKGSRWDEGVSNSTGWSVETTFLIENATSNENVFNESIYQVIRINDGTRFAEIRIYNQKIGFISETFTMSNVVDTLGSNRLKVIGKEDDIKVYLNGELIIDATGLFVQSSIVKSLELGNNTNNEFSISYKYFYYTVSGSYSPETSSEYSNIKFHTFSKFAESEVVALYGYIKKYPVVGAVASFDQDYKIFGVNPDDTEESGAVYGLVSGQTAKLGTTNRTFAPINNVKVSPDGVVKVFAHSQGLSIIRGYVINNFDYEIDFDNLLTDSNGDIIYIYPENYGWDLIHNMSIQAAYFDDNGFNINTIDNFRG